MPHTCTLREGQILTGALFNEPMRVETVRANGDHSWTVGMVGTQSERFRSVTLTSADLQTLTIADTTPTFAGDGNLLRLGLQAYALGIAYEFDPYFGLSVSRVDPLPHQLEAVYDYLLKLAQVRFLLADEAGAGKTIMAAGGSNLLDAIQALSRFAGTRTLADALSEPIRGYPIEAFAFPPGGLKELLGKDSASFTIEADLETGKDAYRYRVHVELRTDRSLKLFLGEARSKIRQLGVPA